MSTTMLSLPISRILEAVKSPPWGLLFLSYLLVEICFYLVFRFYLVPKANERTPPIPYRDYPLSNQRHLLLMRVANRLKRTAKVTNQCERDVLTQFLVQWFDRVDNNTQATAATERLGKDDVDSRSDLVYRMPYLQQAQSSITSSQTSSSEVDSSSLESEDISDDNSTASSVDKQSPLPKNRNNGYPPDYWTVPGMYKEDADEFFAWAWFGKQVSDLEREEQEEHDYCYKVMQDELKLYFVPRSSSQQSFPFHYKARRLTLEDVNPLHRPLLVYAVVQGIKFGAGLLMRGMGFSRFVSPSTGLVGWYRPARRTASSSSSPSSSSPLIFFHGIAPAALTFYLPMVLCGLASDGRACLMIENPNIACTLSFRALTEKETVLGVKDLCSQTLGLKHCRQLTVAGHSFGSCPLTWLLRDKAFFRARIGHAILMDPVTILLSEPDVMSNFLYASHSQNKAIRMVAASELFTEYYLRRHFSWYNSELWLDDIPSHVQTTIGLSEVDEIVNAPKVKRHIEDKNETSRLEGNDSSRAATMDRLRLIYWEQVGHAACVTSLQRWRQIQQVMVEQEARMASAGSSKKLS